MLNELPRYEALQGAAQEDESVAPEACELFLGLLRTGNAVSEVETRYLAQHGITPGRFAVMMLLGREEGKTLKPSELAEMTGVTRATMTGLLDTLERDKLVRRTLDTGDRRSMKVQATPECGALLQKILPGYFRLIAAIPAVLSPEEQKEFTRLAKKLRDGLVLAETKFLTPVDAQNGQ